ncbi:hypothetical protein QBC41DRAFT_40030 [Cercophora samala]|uniref:Uncharacterized protein n=1 Tax=Cercophora samala TaxID=330535 RepID=A0AA39YYE0_9PEZI|nr:hypothetical protein QBC41DRAFT_40030 [Cercophora samala]
MRVVRGITFISLFPAFSSEPPTRGILHFFQDCSIRKQLPSYQKDWVKCRAHGSHLAVSTGPILNGDNIQINLAGDRNLFGANPPLIGLRVG